VATALICAALAVFVLPAVLGALGVAAGMVGIVKSAGAMVVTMKRQRDVRWVCLGLYGIGTASTWSHRTATIF